jgi:hypothetical protein
MCKHKPRKQVAFFVEKGGERKLGYWLEYLHRGKIRSQIAVFNIVKPLFPAYKVALGFELQEYDVPREKIQSWLESKGYRVGPFLED